tara:strand:+ start:1403 stop:1774 length:372 start_codon:yes stop_codon:yes gene_type:complete
MSQRIRIAYSIQESELSEEVRRLIVGANQVIKHVAENVIQTDDVLSLSIRSDISDLREAIYDLDSRLADIDTIVDSYLQYVISPKPLAENHQAQADPELQIEQLKNVLSELQATQEVLDEKPA